MSQKERQPDIIYLLMEISINSLLIVFPKRTKLEYGRPLGLTTI